jgi:hypothetical protein
MSRSYSELQTLGNSFKAKMRKKFGKVSRVGQQMSENVQLASFNKVGGLIGGFLMFCGFIFCVIVCAILILYFGARYYG